MGPSLPVIVHHDTNTNKTKHNPFTDVVTIHEEKRPAETERLMEGRRWNLYYIFILGHTNKSHSSLLVLQIYFLHMPNNVNHQPRGTKLCSNFILINNMLTKQRPKNDCFLSMKNTAAEQSQ